MANKHFIGLVQSVLSSAQAALGEENSPMALRLAKDGVLARRTAEKSLDLLTMLQEKTHGNLDETERDALNKAVTFLRERLEPSPASNKAEELN